MANGLAACFQVTGGIFHFFSILRETKDKSLAYRAVTGETAMILDDLA